MRSIPFVIKNLDLIKEGPQIFRPERGAIAKGKARSEDKKSEAKPTLNKTKFLITMGITQCK